MPFDAALSPELDPRTLRELQALLLRRAMRLVRPQEAPDLVQEVWAAALATMDRFEGRASLATWLTSILRHKAADRYRSARHRTEVLTAFERGEPSEEAPSAEALDAKGELARVIHELDRMPDRARALVIAEVEGDDDRASLARELGVSRETYRVQLCRVRARLREQLAA